MPHLSEQYWQAVVLRQRVLREPLGLTLTVEECLREGAPQQHFGCWELGGPLLACVSFVTVSPGVVKMRQVAVDPEYAGQGRGRSMIEFAEMLLKLEGAVVAVQVHARQSVQGFYGKLGYVVSGEPFTEIGLPHVLMHKRL